MHDASIMSRSGATVPDLYNAAAQLGKPEMQLQTVMRYQAQDVRGSHMIIMVVCACLLAFV
jgi:hypothetical protein